MLSWKGFACVSAISIVRGFFQCLSFFCLIVCSLLSATNIIAAPTYNCMLLQSLLGQRMGQIDSSGHRFCLQHFQLFYGNGFAWFWLTYMSFSKHFPIIWQKALYLHFLLHHFLDTLLKILSFFFSGTSSWLPDWEAIWLLLTGGSSYWQSPAREACLRPRVQSVCGV